MKITLKILTTDLFIGKFKYLTFDLLDGSGGGVNILTLFHWAMMTHRKTIVSDKSFLEV